MAGVLQRFEKRLEGAVTFAFTRTFKSAVQPVEIAAALQQEINTRASIVSRDRTIVPNQFVVRLSPEDYTRLTTFGATLADELGRLVHEHITEQRYTLAGALEISFERDDQLRTGRFEIDSSASADIRPSPRERLTDTAVRAAPIVLEIGGLKHPVHPPGLTIGRGADCDLKIDDPGISRRHADIRVTGDARGVGARIIDLGSTNGVILDGRRVSEADLIDGSQVRLGNTYLTVRIPTPGAAWTS